MLVDNQIIKLLAANDPKIMGHPKLIDQTISFRWPSLLGFLGIQVPEVLFDQSEKMFEASVSALCETEDQESVIYIYDRLFAENLGHIQSNPELNATFLLQKIQAHPHQNFSDALFSFETKLNEHPKNTLHDLILYVAWDRMCLCIARLFDNQSNDVKFLKNLPILKECLIESYQHILEQRHTVPSFYRLLEALFFYEMREENLDKLTQEEWNILSQSFQILKSREELDDFLYLDHRHGGEAFLTLDSEEKVQARLAFACCLGSKIPNLSLIQEPKILHL